MALYVGGTSLLLHGDGVDGSTAFTDETGKTVTPYGNAHISTAQSKFGGASMAFDGSGDYLRVADGEWANLSDTDTTIECFFYVTDISSDTCLVYKGTYGSNEAWFLAVNSTGLHTCTNNGNNHLQSSTPVSINAWHHAALVQQKSVGRKLFLDGNIVASDSRTLTNAAADITIGCACWNNPQAFTFGYIDDLRITKGIALYSADFTPPTSPLGLTDPIQIQIQQQDPGLHKLAKYDPTQAKPVISEVKDDLQDRFPFGTTTGTWEFKGMGVITGTVAEKALPANTPLRRLVRLHREPDGMFVKATWSDAAGNYTFNGVRPDCKYFVTSFDHTGKYRAVIADNLSPTAP